MAELNKYRFGGYRTIRIPEQAYRDLERIRQIEIQRAKQKGDQDWLAALAAMGIGAFAGWLIFKVLRELYCSE